MEAAFSLLLLAALAPLTVHRSLGHVVKRSDDVDGEMTSLKALVERQGAAIQTLQASLAAETAGLKAENENLKNSLAAETAARKAGDEKLKAKNVQGKAETAARKAGEEKLRAKNVQGNSWTSQGTQ